MKFDKPAHVRLEPTFDEDQLAKTDFKLQVVPWFMLNYLFVFLGQHLRAGQVEQ